MELITFLVDFILHVDVHLVELFNQYGLWIYAILFCIIFCETGLVATPFLPGDSLLFAAGALMAASNLNVHSLALLLWLAAVSGDSTNYTVGRFLGARLFANPNSKIFRTDYLLKTQGYFDRYGGRTLIMARFMPIVRTFAPFVAGMGKMPFARFIRFSVLGGFLWVFSFIYAGFYFGGIPAVRKNFTLLILGIIFVSFLPIFIELWRARLRGRQVAE
ncbi:MAG TPA: DedA family protein [Cellvibrionaceae bacterium]|nr:DedA family protein [Cellvibrionaceae bacterium]HMY37875.1 DedA family protein [Marinagarivorans sp.]HNG58357.1 DedA family protein [Cellvibrionaceae bacterium]